MKKTSILGEINTNRQGTKMIVVADRGSHDIDIQFLDEHLFITKNKSRKDFREGKIHNPFDRTVNGVGYRGLLLNGDMVDGSGINRRAYKCWQDMLERVYYKNGDKNPTYRDVIVEEQFHCFSYFLEKIWNNLIKENEFPEDMSLALDKDILLKGNKVYGENRVILVPQEINNMFTKNDKRRGNLPIGVRLSGRKNKPYSSSVSTCTKDANGRIIIKQKRFETVEEAFLWYKLEKENVLKNKAIEYEARGYITKESRLYNALMNYRVEITD